MASVRPYKNPSGKIVWRVQAHEGKIARQRTYPDQASAKRFGSRVDEFGWSDAVSMSAAESVGATKRPASRTHFDVLRESILASDVADWHQLPKGNPFYHVKFDVAGERVEKQVANVSAHANRAVFKADLSIAVEWGAITDLFVDPHDYPDFSRISKIEIYEYAAVLAEVFFGGELVERVTLALVGDGWTLLPAPKRVVGHSGVISWHVSHWQSGLARLLDRLCGSTQYENVLSLSGIVVDAPGDESAEQRPSVIITREIDYSDRY